MADFVPMATVPAENEDDDAPLPLEEHLLELNQLLRTLDDHDERGLVLSLAAFAEDTLGRLLVHFMREPRQAKELVEGFNAPLGTFAARIKAAFALGLLRREQFEDLEVLRRIRNEFAHNWQEVTLERTDLAGLVGSLHLVELGGKRMDHLRGEARLQHSLSWVLVELRLLLSAVKDKKIQAQFHGVRMGPVADADTEHEGK